MLVLLVIIFVTIHTTDTLSCQCASCPPPLTTSECVSGEVTKDECHCCDVCAKAEGEECGGPWGFAGTCASYLFCDVDLESATTPYYDYYEYYNTIGICRPRREQTECCQMKIVNETNDVYVLDTESDLKTLPVCLDNCVYKRKEDTSGSVFCFKKGNITVECSV